MPESIGTPDSSDHVASPTTLHESGSHENAETNVDEIFIGSMDENFSKASNLDEIKTPEDDVHDGDVLKAEYGEQFEAISTTGDGSNSPEDLAKDKSINEEHGASEIENVDDHEVEVKIPLDQQIDDHSVKLEVDPIESFEEWKKKQIQDRVSHIYRHIVRHSI